MASTDRPKSSSTLKGKARPLPPPHSKAKMQQRGEARERFQQLSASTTKAVETIKRSRPANGSSSLLPPADLPLIPFLIDLLGP
ncbi:MAG: hypothetical protein MIN69_24070 [Methylorubrum extorquens]|uniref:hypothetical protein n=1 Tax=Methylorubrum extorquens TaxID=408 RepID=UPI002FEE0AFA